MLKPIPQENPSNGGPHASAKKFARQRAAKNKQAHFMQLRMKVLELQKTDHHLFMKTGSQLVDYLKKAENITLNELNELIHNLQRTMIGLQKKRFKILNKLHQKEQKKKKKK